MLDKEKLKAHGSIIHSTAEAWRWNLESIFIVFKPENNINLYVLKTASVGFFSEKRLVDLFISFFYPDLSFIEIIRLESLQALPEQALCLNTFTENHVASQVHLELNHSVK